MRTPVLCTLALCIAGLTALGCTAGRAGGEARRGGMPGTDAGPGPDEPWSIEIDTDDSDRYLTAETAEARIVGTLTASEGADRVEVDGDDVTLSAAGAFMSRAPVPMGLSHVPVVGYAENPAHFAHGDRAVLRANYIDQGDLNSNAIAMALTPEILNALSSRALGALGGFDLSTFLTPGSTLISDSRCTIIADYLRNSPPTLSLSITDDGRLRAVARVTDIVAGFHGMCSVLGMNVGIREGSEANETTIELSMILQPNEAAPGECSRGLTATDISVNITDFDLDLRLTGSLLLSVAGGLVSEIAEGTVRRQLQGTVMDMVGGAITPALADVEILNVMNSMMFLGSNVDVGLCLVGMATEPGLDGAPSALVARIGARASTATPRVGDDAPGAPNLPVTRGSIPSGTLAIDPGLIGQILFSAWRGGALEIEEVGGGMPIMIGASAATAALLSVYAPNVTDVVPGTAPLSIGISAAMAPLARTPTAMEAAMGVDFFLELGDLRITISGGTGAARRELVVLSSTVRLALTLVPNATGALVPTLVPAATTTDTYVRSTTVPELPGSNRVRLATFVNGLIVSQISPLLEGAAIELPDLGTPLTVTSVDVGTGGFLLLDLAP